MVVIRKKNQKHRFEVLDRLWAVALLTPLQKEFWHIYKEKWDERGKHIYGQDWGVFSVQAVERIQIRLLDGDTEAVSKCMEKERVGVLRDCPILQFPESWGK